MKAAVLLLLGSIAAVTRGWDHYKCLYNGFSDMALGMAEKLDEDESTDSSCYTATQDTMNAFGDFKDSFNTWSSDDLFAPLELLEDWLVFISDQSIACKSATFAQ